MSGRLSLYDGSDWLRSEGTAVSGSAFLEGTTEHLPTGELAARVRSCESVADLRELINRLSGFYAIVHEVDGEVVGVVDHIRSIPLYYAADGSVIADNPRSIVDEIDPDTFDPLLEAEYLLTCYVTGTETLSPSVRTLEAGTLVRIDADGGIDTEQHTDYYPTAAARSADPASTADLAAAVTRAVERVCEVADGRPVWVPLSGGSDSRLVLSELVNQEYEPVVALSFGRPDFVDVVVSERVAEATGVERKYVEYDGDVWDGWFGSEERARFCDLEHNMDFFPTHWAGPALSELERRGELPDDAVFASGQTIGSIGEHLPETELSTRSELIEHVLEHHYTHWGRSDSLSDRLRERIDDHLPEVDSGDELLAAYEQWEWRERQSKWMSQDGSIYSFRGYDWWFPLFDAEVVDVWERLPVSSRRGKAALVEVSDRAFSEAAGGMSVSDLHDDGVARNPLRKLKRAVAESPLEDVVRPAYRYYKERSGIGTHPLGFDGVFGPGQPGEYYCGDQRMRSYMVMHAVDRMSFDPPDESGVPRDCELSIDKIRTLPRVN